jgi:uncharacterized protein YutE (UPF0331/DUF86 family)
VSSIVERLAVLRQQLDHLSTIRPRIGSADALIADRSLRNDAFWALLISSQVVIDVSAQLSVQRAARFEDYEEAIRNLADDPRFRPELVDRLTMLPALRNALLHEFVAIDYDRVLRALDNLDALEEFLQGAAAIAVDTF